MDDFKSAWRASAGVAIGCVQGALPSMLQRKRGTMIFSEASASIREAPHFAALQRPNLPSGAGAITGTRVSTAGNPRGSCRARWVVRGSSSVTRFARSDEKAIDPAEMARTYRWLAEQHASA